MTNLYIVSGPMEGASTELEGEVTFIGRASDNDYFSETCKDHREKQ